MEKENHIQFKTRGDSTNQGKPRVYFCCHPDDFDMYFEPVRNEILDKQNCAVYFYDNASSIPEQERETDLLSMQLFVIPVTTNLLTKPSIAMDKDFPLALKNKIPVLPLIQERGLEGLFARKFGDMQYLDKTQRDTTAISYEEKLEKHLSDILLGDEMTKKIKNEFDAYIFLSYRKADRKCAQELMRLIHKNKYYRDVAIWYDEFLTIGEDYRENIKETLQNSGLFVLVVTPNLLLPGSFGGVNYVMKEEYPTAKKTDVNILPVEMEKTNRSELEKLYPDIPLCVDPNNDDMMRRFLISAIWDMGVREIDNSAEHSFLIGLAYLGGIDVEVDRERAVTLIEDAANCGLAEAMEKLVSMYRTGEGVERNYEEAIKWQGKLVGYWKKQYKKTKDKNESVLYTNDDGTVEDVAELYINASLVYANYLSESGYIILSTFHYDMLKKSCEEIYNDSGMHKYKSLIGDIYYSHARELEIAGRFSESLKWYIKSLEVRQALLTEDSSMKTRLDLCRNYSSVGNIFYMSGNTDKASLYYIERDKILKELVGETNVVEASIRREVAISSSNMGDVLSKVGVLNKAKEFYEASLDIFEKIAEEIQTIEAKRDLASCYVRLGRITANDNISDAKDFLEESLRIREELAYETNTILDRRDMSDSYYWLGVILEKQDMKKALDYYEDSCKISNELLEEALRTDWVAVKRDLARAYMRIGALMEKAKKYDDKRTYFYKAARLYRDAGFLTHEEQDYVKVAICYFQAAMVIEAVDETEDNRPILKANVNKELLQKSYEVWSELTNWYPNNRKYKEEKDKVQKILMVNPGETVTV
ncbi:TIR domain-containing protein [Coprococcus eutactus]|jgi:TPR repeat protein|uniref:TIR domain-containing protein n=1 Tax=Coprococcus eutactus TaxID=33043 RepID=UPI00015EAF4F|nr:TIR domain-containing protein [Coprococcus eutactus]EDP25233.1 tetratricopeptide repeat protein [Coprococcus eutactus ATCC 27759]MBT9754290.1 TIR domain-containing protein [Coprococcus eutactus]UEA79611.1 TIR domain-containing protein [Coprococcus eutactus ATCC 27759]UWP16004.1 TIR domain-containing protein [Coprococcus eutactus]